MILSSLILDTKHKGSDCKLLCSRMAKKKTYVSDTKEYLAKERQKIRTQLMEKMNIDTAGEYYPGKPLSKEERQTLNREVKKKFEQKRRARLHYFLNKVRFENKKVHVRFPKFGYKRFSFRPSQLIQQFTTKEIKRACEKFLKLKQKLEL